jgi:hypothetical protein
MIEVVLAALAFAFLFPLLVAEMLVAYFSVTDSSPLFRRLLVFITFQAGTWTFAFLDSDNRAFYNFFIAVTFPFFLMELVQPASWKPIGNWKRGCWLAQHPFGSIIYCLLLVPVLTLTVYLQFFVLIPHAYHPDYTIIFVLGLTFWGMIVVPLVIRDLIFRHYQRNIIFLVFCNFLLGGGAFLIGTCFRTQDHLWLGLFPGFGAIATRATPVYGEVDRESDLASMEFYSAMYGLATTTGFTAIILMWHWRELNREAKLLENTTPEDLSAKPVGLGVESVNRGLVQLK